MATIASAPVGACSQEALMFIPIRMFFIDQEGFKLRDVTSVTSWRSPATSNPSKLPCKAQRPRLYNPQAWFIRRIDRSI